MQNKPLHSSGLFLALCQQNQYASDSPLMVRVCWGQLQAAWLLHRMQAAHPITLVYTKTTKRSWVASNGK